MNGTIKVMAIALVLILASAAAFSQDKTAEIPMGTATIDGEKDAAYDAMSEPLVTDRMSVGLNESLLTKATVWALWDNTGLYFYAEIPDEKVTGHPRRPNWEQDCLEIFIDENNSKGQAYDADDAQYTWNYQGRATILGGSEEGVEAVADTMDGGWKIEVKIPWRRPNKQAGDKIGIDISVDNTDSRRKGRAGQMSWNQSENIAWTKPAAFGTAILK